MVQRPLRSTTSTIDIYIKLAQYPILADRIRERMREELFKRGLADPDHFEEEVKQRAIESQRREGLHDPYGQEPAGVWHRRLARIRSFHTDFYFAYNLPSALFEQIIQEVLSEQDRPADNYELAFNPELAPWTLLFRQGKRYEALPPPERKLVQHHLEEIKVVLIKGMISDQLPYIAIAKRVLSVDDLQWIHDRRIGTGKIGGKAAGMLLALKILQQRSPSMGPDISGLVEIPESYFLGTDVLYEFRHKNNLDHYMNQKYRDLDDIRDDYEEIVADHVAGSFPTHIVERLVDMLAQMGNLPLIVRSSSLLEDNFGFAFAGKYQSYFCPNQGTQEENLQDLLRAISQIYASTLGPDAILYRRKMGLIDYDERMAVLIQVVTGHSFGRYFLPIIGGVGFSRNPFRWHPKIRREDGFLRMVWGIGTRAVDRVNNDYPRTIALSHPGLRPESNARAIVRYSQHFVDLICLETNALLTLPVQQVLDLNYPYLRFLFSRQDGDAIQEILAPGTLQSTDDLVLTFNYLTRDESFVRLMRTALRRLEDTYETPVDIEFTLEIIPNYPHPNYRLQLLQCRPLSTIRDEQPVEIPRDLPEADKLFHTFGLIPDGEAGGIRYIVFVDPVKYRRLGDVTIKLELGRVIGRLNTLLAGDSFILIGPGRWGSTNIDLGVRVSYADIYNTKVLVEMAVADGDEAPELSYGTHFFQDLVEGGIYSLPLHLQESGSHFNWSFFNDAPNALTELLPADARCANNLKVIDIAAIHPGKRLHIAMDGSRDEAVGYLKEGEWQIAGSRVSLSSF